MYKQFKTKAFTKKEQRTYFKRHAIALMFVVALVSESPSCVHLKQKFLRLAVITGATFLLFTSSASAATIYVSQSATNGYAVGNDANSYAQAQSKSTPKLTLTGAAAAVQSGDTIVINDGTYVEANFVSFSVSNITVNPENDYLAIIQNGAAAGTRVIYQSHLGSNLTLGKIVIDGNNDEQYCYTSDSGTNTSGLTINGTDCLNPTVGFVQGWTRLYNVTMQNNWILQMSSTSNLACIVLAPPAAGAISISSGTITVTSVTDTASSCISILPTASAVPVIISNVSITETGNGANSVNAIYLKGGSTYDVHNNTINITDAAPPSAIEIHNHPTLAASSANVYDNTGTLNTSAVGGYLVLVGDDNVPTTANMISGINVYNNNFTGANHGYLMGYVTGAKVHNNVAKNVIIGFIGKETNSTQFYYNVVNNVTSQSGGLRSKGGTNDVFYNNVVYVPTGSAGKAILVTTNDSTGTNSTGIVFKNNIVVTIDTQSMVDINANNTASFSNNLYYSQSGLTTNSWIYQSASYATLSAWQGAEEASAQYADPLFASSSPSLASGFQLQQFSPAIDAGTDVALTADYAGNSIYGIPDIGPCEYQPSYSITAANIPIGAGIRVYKDGKYRMTAATSSSATANMTITPVGGFPSGDYSEWLNVTVNTWNTSGNYSRSWTENSSAATSTVHTVGDLEANTYYTVNVDGAQYATGQANNLGQLAFTYSGGYSTHTFSISADTAGPTAFTVTSPTGGAYVGNTPTLSWNATTDASSGLASYQVSIDGAVVQGSIATTTTSYAVTSALSCGGHTWQVVAIDNAGNKTPSNSGSFTIVCGGGIPSLIGTVVTQPTQTPAITSTTTTTAATTSTSTSKQINRAVLEQTLNNLRKQLLVLLHQLYALLIAQLQSPARTAPSSF